MFEVLLKYPAAVYQQGDIVFLNVVSVAAWLAAASAVAVLLTASALRGRRIAAWPLPRKAAVAALQFVFVATVGIMLAGPALSVTTIEPGANSVAILLDASASMALPASSEAGRSRFETAHDLIQGNLRRDLDEVAETALYAFDETSFPTDIPATSPTGSSSRLVASLTSLVEGYRGAPLAAVVVFSDGADTDRRIELQALANAGVPVHTIGIGPEVLPGEVRIVDVVLPTDVPPNTRVSAEVVIAHSSSGQLTVRALDGSRLLTASTVSLSSKTPTVRVPLAFDSGSAGLRELRFEVQPPAGDQLPANNAMDRLLAVRERTRSVLYLEGEPRWEFKFIRRALDGDDVVRLATWLRTSDNKTYRQGVETAEELRDGFPSTVAELYRYDAIILGNVAAATLDATDHTRLEQFVAERGGSILLLAGRQALADGGWDVKPLANALPVQLPRRDGGTYDPNRSGRAEPPPAARSAAALGIAGAEGDPWSSLPRLLDYQHLGPLKPAATTLLRIVDDNGNHAPLLVTQPYGHGSAAVLATSSTWRWQMRTAPDDERHRTFWRQLVRQLAGEAQRPRDLHTEIDDDAIVIRLTDRNERFEPRISTRAVVSVTAPDGSAARLPLDTGATPGQFETRYQASAPGVYRVDVDIEEPEPRSANAIDTVQTNSDAASLTRLTRFLRLGANAPEQRQPTQNAALLKRIAEVTGGAYWQPDQAAGLVDALTLESGGVRRQQFLPLWNVPAMLLLLVLIKAGEWLLRRHWGRI